ncbi:MAG: hypothetical protein WAQ28_15725 [Bacteroidia bacterium]
MKPLVSLILMCLCIFTCSAQENNNQHKNYIEVGLNSGVYRGSYTGGVNGAIGMFFTSFGKKSAVDFRAKENYTVSPEREAGIITITYRMYFTRGYYVGGGFAHNHEIAFNNYLEDPVRATMGNSKHIIHRSGLALETGYDFKSLLKKGNFGLYPITNLSMSYLLMDNEPNPFITLSLGLRFGFKKMA